ncbi:MAG: agmatinase [Planctomycetota bacterium]|nr:agmatinase [Planctomycetota bacterium]
MAANFGNIPPEFDRTEHALFTVLSVPYEETTTYGKGTAWGPSAIIDASAQVELYDEELRVETYRLGIRTLPHFRWARSGAGPVERHRKFQAALAGRIGRILDAYPDTTLVSLGGEHSITPAIVSAFKRRYPRLSVLQLDAHADLRNEYEGSPFNHACAMRRVLEHCPVVQVGIRNLCDEEAPIVGAARRSGARRGRLATFFAHEWQGRERMRLLAKRILSKLSRDVYVTVDIDVFDPAFVPGTGTPEPGGLSWYDVLDVLRPVFRNRNVVGFDVVELSPVKGFLASEFTAAKLVYRLMGYKAAAWPRGAAQVKSK